MATLVEVVYPTNTAFGGTGQLNIGPFTVPIVQTLFRTEVRGRVNFFAGDYTDGDFALENVLLWGLQWVPEGDPPNDIVTSSDGPSWLIRESLGTHDKHFFWAPNTDTGVLYQSLATKADWAGQLPINQSIDLWFSSRAPTGVAPQKLNMYGSIRFWWSQVP